MNGSALSFFLLTVDSISDFHCFHWSMNRFRPLLPLNGGGRLGADVIADPIDAANLIDNSTRHVAHDLVRKVIEVGRHVIRRLHAADAANVLIRSAISHHADTLHTGEENNEGLTDGTVLPRLVQLLDHDGIGLLKGLDTLGRDATKDANGKAGTGEGMAPHTHFVDTEGNSKLTDLILEQLTERLDKLQLHGSRETTDIMVRLDGGAGSLVRDGLNHIGIQRALEEKVARSGLLNDTGGLLLEHLNEGGTDDFALLLGVFDVLEQAKEPILGINALEVDATVTTETLENIDGLILAKASIVDQDGMETITNGLVHKDGGDGGVNATADGSNDIAIGTNLFPHLLDELLGVVGHDPILLGTGNVDDEVFQDVLTKRRVRHLGMELQAPHLLLEIFHGNEFGILGTGCAAASIDLISGRTERKISTNK